MGSWAFGRGSRDPGLFPKELHGLRRRVPGRVVVIQVPHVFKSRLRCPEMPVIGFSNLESYWSHGFAGDDAGL